MQNSLPVHVLVFTSPDCAGGSTLLCFLVVQLLYLPTHGGACALLLLIEHPRYPTYQPLVIAAAHAAAAVCCCQVRQKLAGVKADCFLATTLDEVAWLYNLRGSDVPYNPGEQMEFNCFVTWFVNRVWPLLRVAHSCVMGAWLYNLCGSDVPYNPGQQMSRRFNFCFGVWLVSLVADCCGVAAWLHNLRGSDVPYNPGKQMRTRFGSYPGVWLLLQLVSAWFLQGQACVAAAGYLWWLCGCTTCATATCPTTPVSRCRFPLLLFI
jgi:hypothetical protein